MLVILVLLSMMAGGHQQSCLRSLIRHRPHKYWHRFGLTHSHTHCAKVKLTWKHCVRVVVDSQKGRVSACRQCIYHSCTFSRPLFTVLSPVLQYMNPARLAIGEQIFLIMMTLQISFNHHYQQHQQQAHTQQHRSRPWGCQHAIFRVKSPLTSPSTPRHPTQSENLEMNMMMQGNLETFCKGWCWWDCPVRKKCFCIWLYLGLASCKEGDETQQLSQKEQFSILTILLKLIIMMDQHFVKMAVVHGIFGVLNILFLANLLFINTLSFLFLVCLWKIFSCSLGL